jgi:small conductance mechanosensitive channel
MSSEEVEKLITELTPLITTWSLRIVGAIIGFLLARMVAGWIAGAFRKVGERAKLDDTLVKFVANVLRWGFIGMAVIALLGVFGIETTSFAAAIGALGLAIGLAFQSSLSNVAAGVMLLVFRPFKVGDVVRVGGEVGKVEAIDLMSTSLDTPDLRRIIVPNSQVFGSTLENITHHPVRRVDVAVGVDYGADLDTTREVLVKAIGDVPNQADGHDPMVYLTGLGASSVDYSVRVFVKTDDYWGAKEQLTVAVKKALDAEGIGIPFPQMDVHLDDRVVDRLGKAA